MKQDSMDQLLVDDSIRDEIKKESDLTGLSDNIILRLHHMWPNNEELNFSRNSSYTKGGYMDLIEDLIVMHANPYTGKKYQARGQAVIDYFLQDVLDSYVNDELGISDGFIRSRIFDYDTWFTISKWKNDTPVNTYLNVGYGTHFVAGHREEHEKFIKLGAIFNYLTQALYHDGLRPSRSKANTRMFVFDDNYDVTYLWLTDHETQMYDFLEHKNLLNEPEAKIDSKYVDGLYLEDGE